MRKTLQTKFGKNGNCFAACVASITHKKIEDVPQFEECGADGSWFTLLKEWCKANKYAIDYTFITPRGYSIACGKTSKYKRVKHACVYLNGKLCFDPHPSDEDGLVSVDYYITLRKHA